MKTLREMLDATVAAHRDKLAIVEGGRALSYGELGTEVDALSSRLHQRGVRCGDRVAVFLRNGADFVIGYFAAASLGAIVVPLNPGYQKNELRHFIDATSASVIFTCDSLHELAKEVTAASSTRCELMLVGDRAKAPPAPPIEVDENSPAMYQFSSGSTGIPKRIARTHAQLRLELDSLLATLGIKSDDRFLGVAPFSHVNGLMRTMLTSIRAGATLYPLPDYERRAVAAAIEEHRLTVFIGIPFMFIMLAKANFRRPPDLSSLRLCISASAAMPARRNQEFQERFGFFVRQLYGSTETGSISVNLDSDIADSLESVGKPLAGVEVELFDENGKLARSGELAEFAIKSPFAIRSYDGFSDQSSFKDGYFFSGDLGRRDSSDALYLVGRKKFFINRGGYKVDPREIEELLESHPAVEEAVVVGLPTPYGDEKIKAVVVARGSCTEEELVMFCGGRIADFKVPSLIEFRDSLPKTPTGKVQRKVLIQPA